MANGYERPEFHTNTPLLGNHTPLTFLLTRPEDLLDFFDGHNVFHDIFHHHLHSLTGQAKSTRIIGILSSHS